MSQAPLPPKGPGSRSQTQMEKMQFVLSALKRSPFRRSDANLESGLPSSPFGRLQLLNDVCKEIDLTSAANMQQAPETGVKKMVALFEVLGLARPKDSGFNQRLLLADSSLVLDLLHWILREVSLHKKRVYEARLALPITVLAQHTTSTYSLPQSRALKQSNLYDVLQDDTNTKQTKIPLPPPSRPMANGDHVTPTHASRDDTTRRKEQHPAQAAVDTDCLFEEVVEIGLPETWDPQKLIMMSRLDKCETKAKPWLSVAQRWTQAVSRQGNDKKQGNKKITPPKDCLHPTEPGAFGPRVLWRSHGSDLTSCAQKCTPLSGAEIAGFCFPGGVKLSELSHNVSTFKDELCVSVFQVAIAIEDAVEEHHAKKRNLYGICLIDSRRIQTSEHEKASPVIELPRCFCLLTYFPFVELHIRVLRSAVLFGRKLCGEQADVMHSAEARVREAVDRILTEYKKRGVPAPGSELRCVVPSDKKKDRQQTSAKGVHAIELVFERPEAGRSEALLAEALSHCNVLNKGSSGALISSSCKWAQSEYAGLDSTADWSVPLFLAALPASQVSRCLAAALSELQVVVLSGQPGLGAACCLGLAALLRPLLWVAPLVPVLPTQLHAILEAPTPYIVATPRTPAWVECITHRLPHPGLAVLDLDAGALCFHPQDADLVELPNSQALLEALESSLQIVRTDFLKKSESDSHQTFSPPVVTPRMRKAGRTAQRLVAKHVAKLCSIAISLDKEVVPTALTATGKSNRTRESLEFAALLRQELHDDNQLCTSKSGATSVQALRNSVDRSFVASTNEFLMPSDSVLDPNYLHPLRRAFFERLTESQCFQVFRDTFPKFQGADTKEVRAMLGLGTHGTQKKEAPAQATDSSMKAYHRRRSI